MDRTAALRMMHEHGRRARRFINGKLASARKLAELPWGLRGEGAEELEVQWDAGMIPVAGPLGELRPTPRPTRRRYPQTRHRRHQNQRLTITPRLTLFR
jgi:hypothetical protein